MFKRIKNLWRLSEFKPDYSDEVLSSDDLVLRREIFRKPEKRPATIVEDEPLEQFPTEDPEKI